MILLYWNESSILQIIELSKQEVLFVYPETVYSLLHIYVSNVIYIYVMFLSNKNI